MADLKRAITVTRCGSTQLPAEGLMYIGSAVSLSFRDALKRGPMFHRQAECDIAWSHDALLLAGALQSGPRGELRFLLGRFVVLFDELDEQFAALIWQSGAPVSPAAGVW